MKNTRRVLIAENAKLNARLVACGPDESMSRKQLRARLSAARKEVDLLTAQSTGQTAQIESLTTKLGEAVAALAEAKKAKAAEPA